MGELTIAVDRHLNVEQAHRLSEDVEAQIKKEMPQIESMVIHIEPGEERHLRVALPIQEDRGMESPTTPLISQAPYFLFVDTENDTIESWTTKPNPSLGLEKKRGVTIANLLTKEGVTTLLTGGIGEGLFHILSDSFVEIYELPDNTTAKEAVNRLLEGGIERQEQAKEHRTTNSD